MQASKLNIEEMTDDSLLSRWQHFFGLNKLGLALAFGAVMGLASPGFDQWWLAWLALAPFMVLVWDCGHAVEALLSGLCYGLGYHLVALSWCWGLYPLHWLGLDNWLAAQVVCAIWFLEALHESLLMAAFAWLVYNLPMRPGFLPSFERPFFPQLLSVPTIWIFMQWLVGTLPAFLGLPTDQIAYSQYRQTAFIQAAKLAGPGLIDFLIVMANVAIAALWIELSKSGPKPVERADILSPRLGSVLDFGIILALVALVVAWGSRELNVLEVTLAHPAHSSPYAGLARLPTAILQNNITVEQKRLHTASSLEIAQLYDNLSANLGVGLVVLPEGAIAAGQAMPQHWYGLLEGKGAKKEIVTGYLTSYQGGLVNGCKILGQDQNTGGFYIKQRLFPFLEFMPWPSLTEMLPQTMQKKVPSRLDQFTSIPEAQLLTSIWGKIGISISNELIYPRLIAQEVRHGASLLINISDLSYFHNAFLNRQMLANAVLRAAENERFVVLASNTGVSAVVDPAGVIESESLVGRRGTLIDTVQFFSQKTLFTRMWWL